MTPRNPDARAAEAAQIEAADLPPLADAMTAEALIAHMRRVEALLPAGTRVSASVSVSSADAFGTAAHLLVTPPLPAGHKFFRAPTWPEVFAEVERHATTAAVVRRDTIIRKMALAIIELTDEYHLCEEAALIRAGFTLVEIEAHGYDACERASQMAGHAPFAIIPGVQP